MQKKGQALSLILFGIYFFVILYISGFISVLGFTLSLLLYGIIFFGIYTLWKYLRGHKHMSLVGFLYKFISRVLVFISVFILILGSFSVYQNIISPAMIPLYTLTNGEKTVKFQTMSHVGSPSFYTSVQNSILESKQNDYVLFYEGVKPGSPENMRDFSEALGINLEEDLYENFGKLYGIVAQNNDDFLGLVNDEDYNIDLDIDEIMSLYKGKIGNTQNTLSQNGEALDINTEIQEFITELNVREFALIKFINQSIMNFIIKHEEMRNNLISELGNTDIFSVILDERDTHLSDTIIESEFQNIHVIYGLMHFDGVLQNLQANDRNWQIIATEYTQLISNPE